MIQRQKRSHSNQVEVTFILPADFPHQPLTVVGDFNQWNPTANPFERHSNGHYATTLVLDADRRYAFRYLCSNGRWLNEGFADAFETNGFGTDNSVLIL